MPPDYSKPARVWTSASAQTVPAGCGSDNLTGDGGGDERVGFMPVLQIRSAPYRPRNVEYRRQVFHSTCVPGNHVAVEMHDRLTLRTQYVLLCPGPTCSTWAPDPLPDWDGSVSPMVNVKSLYTRISGSGA